MDVELSYDRLHARRMEEGGSEPYLWTLFFAIDGTSMTVKANLLAETDEQTFWVSLAGAPRVWTMPDSAHALPDNLGLMAPAWIPPQFGGLSTSIEPLPIHLRFLLDDPRIGDEPWPTEDKLPFHDSGLTVPGLVGAVLVLLEEDATADSVRTKLHQIISQAAPQALATALNGINITWSQSSDVPINKTKLPPDAMKQLEAQLKPKADQASEYLGGAAKMLVLQHLNVGSFVDADDTVGYVHREFTSEMIAKHRTPFVFEELITNDKGTEEWIVRGSIRDATYYPPPGPPEPPKPIDVDTGTPALDWESLGGYTVFRPALIVHGGEDFEVFATMREDGEVHHLKSQRGGGEWRSLGIALGGGLSAVAHARTTFVAGTDRDSGEILLATMSRGEEPEVHRLSEGQFTSDPTLVVFKEQVVVLGRGRDGAVWGGTYSGTRVPTSFQRLTPPIDSAPAAVEINGGLEIFAADGSGNLLSITLSALSDGDGGGWTKLNGSVSGDPAAAGVFSSRAFATSTKGTVLEFAGPQIRDRGGSAASAPTAASIATGSTSGVIRLVAAGTDGACWTSVVPDFIVT